jgi:DNA (cytosine-5)-methyltransferase 1
MQFGELIIDNFAGAGGASTGIEQATGRSVDIAINHDPIALGIHAANHPHTLHLCESVWTVDPRAVCAGRPVGLAWFSPDCTHHSKARGGKPVEKNIRGLAWVALRWAATVRPRIIVLENVEEFVTWGPVVDGKPCPKRRGHTFISFKNALQRQGYQVEHRELVASDYGAATSRKRFFMIARCDGQPIIWPNETHGPGRENPYRTAADIIDWSLPCHSIFLTPDQAKAVGVRRPLAENTMRRIARGIFRFVIDNPTPFVVSTGHTKFGGNGRQRGTNLPLSTIVSKNEHCLVYPTLIQTGYGERAGQKPRALDLQKPLGTVVAGGAKHALVAAFLAKHYGGNYQGAGVDPAQPLHTVTARDHNALVTSNLVKFRGTNCGSETDAPTPTISAQGTHIGEVRAFLLKYYGTNIGHQPSEPLQTVTAKARFGLVTISGQDYQIADIGMRMLEPHELFAAQGFPDDYIFDRLADGTRLPKYRQVMAVGNSVPPDFARAIVEANYDHEAARHTA